MTILEIQEKIKEKNETLIEVSKNLDQIKKDLNSLYIEKLKIERNHFRNFIELGSTYEFNSYHTLKGKQVKGFKMRAYFKRGDIIKFIRINKKSITIECIERHTFDGKK